MVQVRKDEVQARIAQAALQVFARRGYQSATMAEIAAAAGVSTGNIYRYHPSKEALFEAVIGDELVATLRDLLRKRVEALEGIEDISELPPLAPYHLASEALLSFAIAHRLEVVILLGRALGSKHQAFASQTVEQLIKLCIEHFRSVRPGLRVTASLRFNLGQIYRSLVRTIMVALQCFEDEARIREVVTEYNRFHLAGLRALFQGKEQT